MGYRVEYGGVKKVRGLEKRISRFPALMTLCILLLCTFMGFIWLDGSEGLRQFIFPGNPVMTAAALEDMTDKLHEGVPLQDVLHTFCVQILEDAELDSD